MNLKDKLQNLTDETSSKWVEEAKDKVANKGVRRKARMIALEVLRILRERNMSQTDLAAVMEVSRQQVAKIVKGQENLTLGTIDKLEKALGEVLISIGRPELEQKDELIVAVASPWIKVAATNICGGEFTVHMESAHVVSVIRRSLPTREIDLSKYVLSNWGWQSYIPTVYQPKVTLDESSWDVYKPEGTEMSNFS